MFKNRQLRLLLTLALAIIGLVVLAAGLSNLRFGPATFNVVQLLIQRWSELRFPDSVMPKGVPDGDGIFQFLRFFIWFGLLAAFIYAFINAKFRKRLLSILVFVFLLFFIVDRLESPAPRQRPEVEEGGLGEVPGAVAEALPPTPEIVAAPPGWLTAVIALALALLIVVGIWLVWRRLRLLNPDVRSELVEAAEQTLADLDRGANVRDAVLRCYTDMTHHLSSNPRLKRHRSMTPREFDSHLARAGLNDEHIHRLTRLFETVRYGGRASDEPMAREARACLSSIVSTYGGDR